MNEALLEILRCPIDGQALQLSDDGAWLVNARGGRRYPVEQGIALLVADKAQSIAQLAPPDSADNG